ncbi:cell division protein FtsQ/DivIB [Robiginitalea sediminis]|uniref:cell division protein FtsQ/DivIB n=1 Tax=Robiginitalea sediminis TaxID=1982593 RepID=UPI0029373EC8|nr:cell division protein FtsQ/DivIB [Robiginitalea sediminis]
MNKWKLIGLCICITGLYAFTDIRSNKRQVQGIRVQFTGPDALYMTESAVNKLLIQNYGSLQNVPQEAIVLNTIESVLRSHDMVKSAQVYLTVNGELNAKITQRHPIGRVAADRQFYLDDQGTKMPLSANHSARVPIITGKITGKSLEDAYVILKFINEDPFLSKNVIGIHIEEEGDYRLKFRMDPFEVHLGGVADLKQKFDNFKAFYAKAAQDKTLAQYQMVSLEFENQVVCTKI